MRPFENQQSEIENALPVSREAPWLGLVSFTEETRGYFHGRDEEAAELGRRVQRKLLTVLFGQSGLGKTSILQAGLVPRLRPEGFCPVYVRLDYDPASPPPAEQIKRAVFRSTEAAGTWTRSGTAVAGETLWEFLHHRDDVLKDPAGRTLIPILIFDQFEEIFTLAQSDDAGRRRAQEFLADLADLVENRPPAALEARIERDEADAAKFDFARADYRLLISLREDYLAHLEGLKTQMPSVTQNRMRLARMNGAQAVAAVRAPAPHLVGEAVAEAVVRFVAGGADLAHAEVEPSLLSLICRELNHTRLARGQAEISADLLAGSRDTILSEFYERALADQPAGVRIFIEDEMLTDSGFRESVAEERVRKAFVAAGAEPGALALLVNRRLLRVEDRLDLRRVEITHDVLCSVVGAGRNVRREREALEESRRQLAAQQAREQATRRALVRARLVAAVAVALMLVAAGSAVFGWINLRRAHAAEAQALATRQLAEQARGEAEKLVAFLLDDFYDELAPTGRLETVGQLAQRAVAYYDGLPAELQTPQTRRYRGMALVREGGALYAHGDFKAASPVLAEAKSIFEKLRAAGDRSEETTVGLALVPYIRTSMLGLADAQSVENLKAAADLLRPLASAPRGSARVRRVYVDILNDLSHSQPKETAIATCEEARKILAGLGALDLSDLGAASAYGDVSDSEARHALDLGRLDEAERLEREVDDLAARVLAKRPGDLRAMEDRYFAPNVLATVAMRRFEYESALAFARESEQAAGDYVRFNPADSRGWSFEAGGRAQVAEILGQEGKITEQIGELYSAAALERDSRNTTGVSGNQIGVWAELALLQTQRGRPAEAAEALVRCRRSLHDFLAKTRAGEGLAKISAESLNGLESQLDLARGAADAAYARAQPALERMEKINPEDSPQLAATVLRQLRGTMIEAGLRTGHYAEAEAAARAVLAQGRESEIDLLSKDAANHFDLLLAQAVAAQGRKDEARKMLEPVLARYRDQKSRGAAHVDFLQNFARACYVEALTEPDGPAGLTARSAALNEAAGLLAALPAEAKQLHFARELAGWIATARADGANHPGAS